MSKPKRPKSDFIEPPTLPDGRYRATYQRYEYDGTSDWLCRAGVRVGRVWRKQGTWYAETATGMQRGGFMTHATAGQWLEEQCDAIGRD